jgi:hypothetical protein
LDLSNNGRIVNLVNPSSAQDAATKFYVDGATTNMATTSSVSTAITNALGSSGTQDNRPTVAQMSDNINYRILFTTATSGRATLVDDNVLTYNPGTNILTSNQLTASVIHNSNAITMRIGTIDIMRFSSSGYVGIGTISPAYPIHVDVTTVAASSSGASSTTGYWWGSGASSITQSSNISSTPASQIAMKLNGSVWIDRNLSYVGFWQTSDRRIKKNINYNISSECVTLFRKLKCTNYSFVDEREHKTNVYGYIAQDVSTVLPYAVTTQTGFIPSLYSLAKISRENGFVKITCSEQKPYIFHSLHDKDGTVFVTDKNEPASDKDGGRHFKVKLFDISMNEFIVKIKQIVDNGVFTIENDETSVKLTDTEYFVFGQEVDDYKILNNEAITMVATAALQEVDRQQQADKARIAELETTVAAQQSLINDILERLKKAGV